MADEIICIEDSPLRVTLAEEDISDRRQSLDYSSDVSLPEMPLVRTLARGARHVVASRSKLSQDAHLSKESSCSVVTNLRDASSAITLVEHSISQPTKVQADVIDLDSSDQELEILAAQTNTPAPLIVAPPLQKSISLPTRPETLQPLKPIAMSTLSSNILQNIDKLMEKTKPSKLDHKNSISRKKTVQRDDVIAGQISDDEATQIDKTQIYKAKKLGQNLAAKALKAAEREELKKQRTEAKEAKLAEKRKAQSIAAVNTLKKSKKDSTPEMILHICESIKRTALHTHMESFMEELGCSMNLCAMPVPGLITFQRHVKARYDMAKGYWLPLETPQIDEEDQLIVYLKASEYVRLAQTNGSLASHVESIRNVRPSAKIMYLIEGLAALLRQSQTARNRAYQSAVRAMAGDDSATTKVTKSRARPVAEVNEEAIEDSLIDLQVLHGCLIVHSTAPADTAEHLSVLTSDLSTIPYKQGRDNLSLAFCTEVGQIRTGSDGRDTFEKMLQSITRVTPQIAQAIAARYINIRALYKALEAGPQVLQSIPKGHNVDGSVTGQLLGPATSMKIHRALMSSDSHAEA